MSNPTKSCPRLSVAMIVRDAEDCIAATLDAVRELADEIVVVDMGSHDGTARIARQKATSVIPLAWNDDFSAARNACLKALTGDWVLWMEAGETITSQTAIQIREFVDRLAERDTAYYLLIRTQAQAAHIAGEQSAQLRLHPRRPEITFTGRVRESMRASLERLEFKTMGLSWTIDRDPRENRDEIKQERCRRNLHLARLAIQEEGRLPRLLNCMAEACQMLGDNNSSAKLYREALDADAGGAEMLEAYYGLLTALEGNSENREAQLAVCMQSLEHFPLDAQLLCALGGYLQAKGQTELASRSYQIAAEHGQINLEVEHLEGLTEIAVSCYALTLQLLGKEDEATLLLEKELASQPNSSRVRRQLLDLHVKHGRRDAALHVVNGMPRNIPNREALRSAVRGACLAAAGNAIAARSYLETAYKAGCRDVLCLRWLTTVQLAANEAEVAAETWEQWHKVEPHGSELKRMQTLIEAARRKSTDDAAGKFTRVDDGRRGILPVPTLSTSPLASRTSAETK